MIEKYVDAEELGRLLSSLAAVLCGLVIAGLFASIVVPGLRNANKPETPVGTIAPVRGETGWLDPAEFPAERGRIVPQVDPRTLIEPSTALTAHGKELFENNCVQCHGSLGRGDGPAAGTMNPHPRNFTSPLGWKNGYDLPGIFKTLSEGVPGTSMASFDYLIRSERMALAQYVQSLAAFPHNTASPHAMEALAKELASPGEKTPNKIPVSTAIAKLEEEFVAPRPLELDAANMSPGAEVLRRVVINRSRAAQVLADSDQWRRSPSSLAAAILPDAPEDGFSVNTADLSPADWNVLHAELLKQIRPR
jgi:mono/diheme cytochrome c family protein